MAKIKFNADLVHTCKKLLMPGGRLSTAIHGFTSRTSQITLVEEIAKNLEREGTLVAEAGTGTGKTFAYLIPALLSQKKTLISTATKTLQDQLFLKDLPELINALGIAKQVQILKGRSNYLCEYRTKKFYNEGTFTSETIAHEVLYVHEKWGQLVKGERTELPELSDDSAVWPYVTSTTDNCLGSECPFIQTCFLVSARKRSQEADLVVINHHLFFADSKLKEHGFGELLPNFSVIIFDEAHQLSEIANHFYGLQWGTRQIIDLIEDSIHHWPILDLANSPLKSILREIKSAVENLVNYPSLANERLNWNQLHSQNQFKILWQQFNALCATFINFLNEQDINKDIPELLRCKERALELQMFLETYELNPNGWIRWLERFKHHILIHLTPLEVQKELKEVLNKSQTAYIYTSATLAIGKSFDHFILSLGLDRPQTLQLESPFKYPQQALCYFPRGLPDSKHSGYYDKLVERSLPIVQALEGKCFFLFTSHRALQEVAVKIKQLVNYPVLVQGEESKPILLSRFRQYGNAILLGTSTFWEGVDVKGEALSCVMIDKLPFPSPTDPIIRGKMQLLKTKGLSSFDELMLPHAIFSLKQGVGRLIRDEKDKGVLIIFDPRIIGRPYGYLILASLPNMKRTRCENRVLTFINKWSEDECIGT